MIIGVVPEIVDTGFIKSSTLYTALHTPQPSPYWSSASHFGHVPFINLSDKNIFSSVSKSWFIDSFEIRSLSKAELYISSDIDLFSSE